MTIYATLHFALSSLRYVKNMKKIEKQYEKVPEEKRYEDPEWVEVLLGLISLNRQCQTAEVAS